MSDGRYSRQERFRPIGQKGQSKLEGSHVLIIGAGALGTSSSEQLVRAGVGKLTIVDRDYVELSNLQRQQLYTEADAAAHLPKAEAAKRRLSSINSTVSIEGVIADVQREELLRLADGVDLMMDGTDNFETRMLMNDVAQKYNIPYIYGGCVGGNGLVFSILPEKTPCLGCLLERVPLGGATCDTVGVISPAVQMVTALQVAEALKILTGDFARVNPALMTFDLWNNDRTSIKVSNARRKDCPSCGDSPVYPYLEEVNATKFAVLCGRDTVQIRPSGTMKRDFAELKRRLPSEKVKENPFLLSYDHGKHHRMVFFRDGRVLIHGTKDVIDAKKLYYEIVGG
ncbi:thiazole biosynthesis adenylyltransferase ThiF [Bacillus sp. SB49]|uniref:ThiF family adenylyltransferase n=1 Tax=Bacillus sp. SB49 TaxID=1071080 RepID=UPI00047C175C|nr:ThiF family adenylyltransferase [Bacillus sp. SB49]QHT45289.1 thiazole biosynthesis adenylyltransferase ThiF [Bacillus sp. SB49]